MGTQTVHLLFVVMLLTPVVIFPLFWQVKKWPALVRIIIALIVSSAIMLLLFKIMNSVPVVVSPSQL
jgi:hypothetical protein